MPLPPGRGTCSVEGCDRDIFTLRGWCEMHYQRWRRHGDPAWVAPVQEAVCTTAGCAEAVRCSGLCESCYQRARYEERRLKAGKSAPAARNPTCPICGTDFERVRRQKYCTPECARTARQFYYLERDYGVTAEQFSALLKRQGGLCAICGQPDRSAKNILHVDHCHETCVVRGLLCHRCNIGLGHFQDDPALLTRAAEYLET